MTPSELTFDHLYELAEWMIVRADRDTKWAAAYQTVRDTIRRIDASSPSFPWMLAAKYLLDLGVGLTARDMRALGNRSCDYVRRLSEAGCEIVGVPMAPEPRRGPRRLRYYRADLVPESYV
jgi:hypothetical protein